MKGCGVPYTIVRVGRIRDTPGGDAVLALGNGPDSAAAGDIRSGCFIYC